MRIALIVLLVLMVRSCVDKEVDRILMEDQPTERPRNELRPIPDV